MYTPDQLDRSDIVEDENPYAGTLTLNIQRINANKEQRNATTLRVGTSGHPSFADETQIFVHDTLTNLGKSQTHPNGWDNQIETEPLLNIDHEKSWFNYKARVTKYTDLVSVSTVTARLGNINTDAIFTHGWKFGYNIPDFNRQNFASKSLSTYSFLDIFSTARARNIYYDGGIFRDSPHTVDKEIVVNGLDAGVAVEYNSYAIKFHYNIRTKDYKEQDTDFHAYGFLTLGTAW